MFIEPARRTARVVGVVTFAAIFAALVAYKSHHGVSLPDTARFASLDGQAQTESGVAAAILQTAGFFYYDAS